MLWRHNIHAESNQCFHYDGCCCVAGGGGLTPQYRVHAHSSVNGKTVSGLPSSERTVRSGTSRSASAVSAAAARASAGAVAESSGDPSEVCIKADRSASALANVVRRSKRSLPHSTNPALSSSATNAAAPVLDCSEPDVDASSSGADARPGRRNAALIAAVVSAWNGDAPSSSAHALRTSRARGESTRRISASAIARAGPGKKSSACRRAAPRIDPSSNDPMLGLCTYSASASTR
mmetsp:Transcript_9064/g.29777  ORF Transcript_9064/g.29777 Transcript_9064/m.29777 type:complete len:235 (+) Transcript_9064:457-1161(+)